MNITDLVYIDETGYHTADYPAFLQWYEEQYRAIYGADVYIAADSQDGEWLAVQAKAAFDLANLGASSFNSFSPATAQGVGLSRQVKINGISRRIPTNSTVDLTISGTSGTTLNNAVAIDQLEQKWDIPDGTLIPGGGEVTVTATAQELGAINAQADSVNRIFTPTLGWQTVNNDADATPGEPVETDAELRIRQQISVADPSLTVLDGTVGGVANVTGVTAVRAYENDTSSTDSNGIPSHSICLVVAGGDAVDICQEIALHKTPGTGTFGNTDEIVFDSHGMPLDIKFQRPDLITVKAEITISVNSGFVSDTEALIAAAVASAIEAYGIGGIILYTKLYLAAYLPGTPANGTFDVVSIEIAKDGDPLMAANIELDFDEMPVCDPTTDVTIVG